VFLEAGRKHRHGRLSVVATCGRVIRQMANRGRLGLSRRLRGAYGMQGPGARRARGSQRLAELHEVAPEGAASRGAALDARGAIGH
jgi:hypothetical protein